MSQDGKLLAAADRDGRVYLWDADTGKRRLMTAAGYGKRLAISPDGQWLASGEDGAFALRDLRNVEVPRTPLGDTPRVFAFAPDSKAIAVGYANHDEVILLDLKAGKQARQFAGLDAKIDFSALAFSPDGAVLSRGRRSDRCHGQGVRACHHLGYRQR